MKCSRPECPRVLSKRGLCRGHWKLSIRQGIHGYTDSGAVRTHVLRLRDLHWSWEGIAAAAATSPDAVAEYFKRPSVRRSTERSVLSIPLVVFQSSKVTVPVVGLSRRRDGLACMGWPLSTVAERADTTAQAVCNAQRRGQVVIGLNERFSAVYDELQNVEGPSRWTATRAHNKGLHPPMAWEYVDIDDPEAKPFQRFHAKEAA